MHIHILGICGTFMGSLALLARQLGHEVTGSDQHVYPPMSTQLEEQGIALLSGYDPAHLHPTPDLVIIGNALSRGNPAVEAVLNRGLPYVSGPQWLHDQVLPGKWVIAVAGTHGKTTTSSMVAWILEYAGLAPGYLIGGIPQNLGVSASLGQSSFFVVEADEYDTAFFDKRSKFVHYSPRTCVLNNIEFDHADIFTDLAAIQRQFHHLVRIVPGQGLIIHPTGSDAMNEVLAMGCWTPRIQFGAAAAGAWHAQLLKADGSEFVVYRDAEPVGEIRWELTGQHNVANALAALVAAWHVGVMPGAAVEALCRFTGVRRRMELISEAGGIRVYDDFAHHPTAIRTTLDGLRARVGQARLVAVIEPRSNTMRLGTHQASLAEATAPASEVVWYQPPGLNWALDGVVAASRVPARVSTDLEVLARELAAQLAPGDLVVLMSNGGFGGLRERLPAALNARFSNRSL